MRKRMIAEGRKKETGGKRERKKGIYMGINMDERLKQNKSEK